MKMRVRIGLLAVLGVAAPASVSAQFARDDATLHAEVVAEMNVACTRPQAYVARLTVYRPTINGAFAYRTGKGPRGNFSIRTRTAEGVAAVDEAIAFLRRQPALPPLAADAKLRQAAQRFADEQARTGVWGHQSADGSSLTDRIARDGTRRNYNAETIMYGSSTARDIVMHLIIDDGVPDRGHREVIFDSKLTLVGTACRPHPKWMVCVSEYSSSEPASQRRSR